MKGCEFLLAFESFLVVDCFGLCSISEENNTGIYSTTDHSYTPTHSTTTLVIPSVSKLAVFKSANFKKTLQENYHGQNGQIVEAKIQEECDHRK